MQLLPFVCMCHCLPSNRQLELKWEPSASFANKSLNVVVAYVELVAISLAGPSIIHSFIHSFASFIHLESDCHYPSVAGCVDSFIRLVGGARIDFVATRKLQVRKLYLV